MRQTSINREGSLIIYPTLGLLLNGAWTLLAHSLRQQGTIGIYWSAQITLLSGWKLSLWQILGMWLPRNLFGKTLSLSLRSLVPLSWTMVFSLIVNLLEDTAVIWEL